MLPYWLLFLFAAAGAAFEGGSKRLRPISNVMLAMVCLFIAFFVGTRDSIGADWGAYLRIFSLAKDLPLIEALAIYDPGYMLVNALSIQLGGGIYLANAFFATIFAFGLHHFARYTPRPVLAVTVAIPYLVIVVAMGYSRQAAAVGIILVALPAITNGKIWRYLFLVCLAAMFHKSAIMMGPLAVIAVNQSRPMQIAMATAILSLLYVIFLEGNTDRFERIYLEKGTSSAGALLRIGMSAIAAIGWLLIEKRLMLTDLERRFWRLMSFGSIALFGLLPFFPSSTALDRVGIYFMPIQLLFSAHIVERVGQPDMRGALAILVIAFYGLFLATWFATTNYIDAWVPYRSIAF